MDEKEPTSTRVKWRYCGYELTYASGAKRAVCPNCEVYVKTGKDITEVKTDFQFTLNNGEPENEC
jgi:hypothetical protein